MFTKEIEKNGTNTIVCVLYIKKLGLSIELKRLVFMYIYIRTQYCLQMLSIR